MDKKFLYVLATVVTLGVTLFCFLWAVVFGFDPLHPQHMSPLFNLSWTAFAGLGLVIANQGSFKNLPNMLCSGAVGPLYGVSFFYLLAVCMKSGLGSLASFTICVMIITFVMCILHLIVLEKTWFNMLAMTLVSYCLWLALKNPADPGNYNWLYGTIFFLIGICYGTVFVPTTMFILKYLPTPGAQVTAE